MEKIEEKYSFWAGIKSLLKSFSGAGIDGNENSDDIIKKSDLPDECKKALADNGEISKLEKLFDNKKPEKQKNMRSNVKVMNADDIPNNIERKEEQEEVQDSSKEIGE